MIPAAPSLNPTRLARTAAIGVALGYGALLVLFGLTGKWIFDSTGNPLVVDFLPVHVAGQMAMRGSAALAYDPQALHRAQVDFLGHDFSGFLGWHYPPLFLLAALLLAMLPYAVAFFGWVAATAAAFVAVLARIGGARAAWAGLALPPALASAMVGQNGFFTAALFGGFLLTLPARPVAAGLLIAALAYKPQFEVLIPLALLAGGHWRAFIAALAGVIAWIAASAVMAPATLAAFLHFLPQTSGAVLGQGTAGWFKLQSVYGLVRLCGGGDGLGWGLQIAAITAAAALVVVTWSRRGVDPSVKSAMLAAAALLATPYVYFYDLPLLAVALAFLWRQRDFDGAEQAMLAASVLCLAAYALAGWPLGLFAIVLTLAMAARRAF